MYPAMKEKIIDEALNMNNSKFKLVPGNFVAAGWLEVIAKNGNKSARYKKYFINFTKHNINLLFSNLSPLDIIVISCWVFLNNSKIIVAVKLSIIIEIYGKLLVKYTLIFLVESISIYRMRPLQNPPKIP